ncbi:MAG: hypothetical protein OXC30_05555 [Alphaproteobacteria bacterium]|nr:hypothetical protein [Alphaproteobacteria bacterium]
MFLLYIQILFLLCALVLHSAEDSNDFSKGEQRAIEKSTSTHSALCANPPDTQCFGAQGDSQLYCEDRSVVIVTPEVGVIANGEKSQRQCVVRKRPPSKKIPEEPLAVKVKYNPEDVGKWKKEVVQLKERLTLEMKKHDTALRYQYARKKVNGEVIEPALQSQIDEMKARSFGLKGEKPLYIDALLAEHSPDHPKVRKHVSNLKSTASRAQALCAYAQKISKGETIDDELQARVTKINRARIKDAEKQKILRDEKKRTAKDQEQGKNSESKGLENEKSRHQKRHENLKNAYIAENWYAWALVEPRSEEDQKKCLALYQKLQDALRNGDEKVPEKVWQAPRGDRSLLMRLEPFPCSEENADEYSGSGLLKEPEISTAKRTLDCANVEDIPMHDVLPSQRVRKQNRPIKSSSA